MAEVYYHTTVAASGAVAAAREIQIGRFPATVNVNFNANLNAQPISYCSTRPTRSRPVLADKLAIGVTGIFGRPAQHRRNAHDRVWTVCDNRMEASATPLPRSAPVSASDTEVKRRRPQFHDLSDRRHSGRRLRSGSPLQPGIVTARSTARGYTTSTGDGA